MATLTAAPPITIEQYLGFEGFPGLRDELINGRIILSPQPKPLHQNVVLNLFRSLDRALGDSEFMVQMNSNIRFEQSISMPAPDIFVIRKQAWRQAIELDIYLAEPPLLVAEVISPSNRRRKVKEKVAIYLNGGVQHVWVFYPKKMLACIARSTASGPQLRSVNSLQLDEPVHLDVSAAALFAY